MVAEVREWPKLFYPNVSIDFIHSGILEETKKDMEVFSKMLFNFSSPNSTMKKKGCYSPITTIIPSHFKIRGRIFCKWERMMQKLTDNPFGPLQKILTQDEFFLFSKDENDAEHISCKPMGKEKRFQKKELAVK